MAFVSCDGAALSNHTDQRIQAEREINNFFSHNLRLLSNPSSTIARSNLPWWPRWLMEVRGLRALVVIKIQIFPFIDA